MKYLKLKKSQIELIIFITGVTTFLVGMCVIIHLMLTNNYYMTF
jgi:hypothetical protein